jgi:hypothetical protein
MAKSTKIAPPAEGEENTKASFWIRTSLVKKLRYISVMDEVTQTEIIDQLLSKYIADWEKKNGEIPKR